MSGESSLSEICHRANYYFPGVPKAIELFLVSLLSRRHLLLEGPPGHGKTSFVKLMSKLVGLPLTRIQFTNDMLPADIIGHLAPQHKTGELVFSPGPLFSEFLLADELNRASPKTQSALLEAMEERQVTFEGKSYPLSESFFVTATQNPYSQVGTHHLPESQLDRFMIASYFGVLDKEHERAAMIRQDMEEEFNKLTPLIDPQELKNLCQGVNTIFSSEAIVDYIQEVVERMRAQLEGAQDLSLRAVRDLYRGSKAMALILGRTHVLPEDVRDLFPFIIAHRLNSRVGLLNSQNKVREFVEKIPIF